LPELREQTPGNAAVFYRKAGELLDRIPPLESERANLQPLLFRWQQASQAGLPRDEVRKTLALFQEPLELLHKGARCETCDFGFPQRIRDRGRDTPLPEVNQMHRGGELLCLKARLELLDDRPDLALRTLQTAYALGRHLGGSPAPIFCAYTGMNIASGANRALEMALSHPRTPNLSWSLVALPRPFFDLRKPFEGHRLTLLGSFPGLLEVAGNPDAGPLPAEQIEKIVSQLTRLRFIRSNLSVPLADRIALGESVLKKHDAARKALAAAGRSPDKILQWPHLQVALMHSTLECDQYFDEVIQWQAFPYWQAAEHLEALEKKSGSPSVRGPDAPAIALVQRAGTMGLQAVRARDNVERAFTVLRLIEAIRLHAAIHEGKLPRTLADIKEVPVPTCPLTGKSFEYRIEGNRAFLSAPPFPRGPQNGIESLEYEITLRPLGGK